MDAPIPPKPTPLPHLAAFDSNQAAWKALVDELTLLNVKLEYLKLMLKLRARQPQ